MERLSNTKENSNFSSKLAEDMSHMQEVGPVGDPLIIRDVPGINWKEFACGWGAALINITTTYPINKIIFRQMLHGVKMSSAFEELRIEGLSFLYRGMLPPLIQKTFSLSIMFGVYEEVRRPLLQNNFNPYLSKATAAVISGSTEAILMPFERIQTLLADSSYHKDFRNTVHAFRAIGTNYGFREYYRGLVPILLRNGPSNVGFFIIREEVHEVMPKFDSQVTQSLSEFLSGAMIGVVLSSLFYPLNVVKVAMQSKLGGEFENCLKVLVQIYHERGGKLRYVYRGVHTNCTRAFLSWGVMNCAYEYLKELVY